MSAPSGPPDDLTTAAVPGPAPAEEVAAYVLTVVEGPDTGSSFVIDGTQPARTLVGQSPACDFRLTDRRVSRRHLALDLAGRRLRITDLGSMNGTFVDAVSVIDGHLRGGEIVRLGGTAIRVDVRFGAAQSAKPTAMGFGRILGSSDAMRRLYPLCERLAASNVTVILEGETGTGKEVLAESLHEMGPRRDAPFLVFDCTAVPGNLVESALFGHEQGAFTGAIATHRGFLEQANGGTLLIDEIGDLDLSLQPKLLRALERREVRRVGGDRNIPVDVRVLAATRRDLDQAVQSGRFRDDLYFRLAVARIELPPLRERGGDVGVLTAAFWRALGGAGEPPYDLVRRFESYQWPGNVRELQNAVARHLALGHLDPFDASGRETDEAGGEEHPFDAVLGEDLPLVAARQRIVQQFERRYVEWMLERHGGDVARAAQAAGIARRYFQLLRAKRTK